MQQALVHIVRHFEAAAAVMCECLVEHMQGQRHVVRHCSLSTTTLESGEVLQTALQQHPCRQCGSNKYQEVISR